MAGDDLTLDPSGLTLADHESLRRRIGGLHKVKKRSRRASIAAKISDDIERAEQRFAARARNLPTPSYPAELPITARRAELVDMITNNQVVVIAGETGSGKSTQLPKMCLDAGFGVRGTIGHTQPRRIAARAVAARVAEELKVKVGGAVGYAVRFDNRTSEQTAVKVMTDGILLAEMARDPDLLAYDAIIVDEAHERSLNIDFLLGYLHRLVARRSDLHVVITSATIDTEKIAAHFDHTGSPAPIIEVSGRAFPVDVRYQPRDVPGGPDGTVDAASAVRQAVNELEREGPGDVLVFSSGEREINDICEHLRRHEPTLDVLPLYARLPTKDQQKVFGQSTRRRVIVSTNVAETSLTVPGIRYVIDVGEARMSRFSQRTKVQRLPIEAISQASANQRSGRCGRLGPGIAIRLYAEDDFDARPAFTEPEIQRTNLASVILTMASQRLGSPLDFPFIDPPEERAVADGARLLHELNAVEGPELRSDERWLTDLGRQLARMPIDPRLGRIVIGGDDEGCLHEAVIIAAALAVQDPRERPRDRQQAADDAHRSFTDERSDVLTLLHLWHAARDERRSASRRQFTRWCRDRFLHAQRMSEWFDTIEQLRTSCDELDIGTTYSSDFDVTLGVDGHRGDDRVGDDIHRAVLAGMLSQIGMRVERSHEYLGPRSIKFAIQPGSTCFETRPPWIMSTTLVETSRLWARNVAPIDPAWVEEPAQHLTSIELGEAWWDPDRARAMTTETVRLFGLPVVAERVAPLDRHEPVLARQHFIRYALVEGDWTDARHRFLTINASVRHEARNLAARSDRRTFDDEDQLVYTFYDAQLPSDVASGAHFESWFRSASGDNPHLLELALDDLLGPNEIVVDEHQYPDQVEHGSLVLDLDYQESTNAIAVDIPVTAIGQIDPTSFLGIVPGHRRNAVVALVRALPKIQRKRLVPVPQTVDVIMAELETSTAGEDATPFALGLRHALERRIGEQLPLDALDPRSLPPELRPHYRVLNPDGEVLARGYDIEALRSQLTDAVDQALEAGAEGITHPGATTWEFGDLPKSVTVDSLQGSTLAYPALVDRNDRVGVELFSTPEAQRQAMWAGVRRLLRITIAAPLREMNATLNNRRLLALPLTPHGERAEWFEDLTLACLGTIIDDAGLVWSGPDFEQLQKRSRDDLSRIATAQAPVAGDILDETASIRMALAAADRLPADCVRDARDHLERLTYPGHLAAVGIGRFDDVLRYLRGITHRLDKLASRTGADRTSMHQIQAVEEAYDTVSSHLRWSPALESIAWSLEELRISMFAQHLGTTERVSPTRIRRRLEKLAAA